MEIAQSNCNCVLRVEYKIVCAASTSNDYLDIDQFAKQKVWPDNLLNGYFCKLPKKSVT